MHVSRLQYKALQQQNGGVCTPQDIANYKEQYPQGQTQAEAQQQFSIDAPSREKIVNDEIKVQLTQEQFNALVSFVYNEGFLGTKLSQPINAGKCDSTTITNAFNSYTLAIGDPHFLDSRRASESNVFNDGVYQ